VIDTSPEAKQQPKQKGKGPGKKYTEGKVTIQHLDIIKDEFWNRYPYILADR
jgi:hypothetical protein